MTNEKWLIDMEDALRRMENAEHLMHSINGIKVVDIGALRQFFGMLKPVDAVEVVHGQWVFGTANHREYMKCSVCLKSQTPTGVFTYCPNCGAKMDGGINE